MTEHFGWLLAPSGVQLPTAHLILSTSHHNSQLHVEAAKTSPAFKHLSMNGFYFSLINGTQHHVRRCFKTSCRREDCNISLMADQKAAFSEVSSRPVLQLQDHKLNATDEDIALGKNPESNLAFKVGHSSTTLNVRRTRFSSAMDSKKLKMAIKAIVILSGVQIIQGSTEASAAMTQGVNDYLGDGIGSGFASAFLLIFFSELGDKTFFIAALLASRKSNVAVFTGTFGALVAMTFISVVLGRAFHYIDGVLPFSLGEGEIPVDDLAAVGLLIYFGISSLLEASSMKGSKAEGEQQEAELAIAGVDGEGVGLQASTKTVIATFVLVFAAEWGDKSFFSTIALAAASSPLGVVAGAIAGHGAATLIAVLGGSMLGNFVSEKVIAYIGGVLFLVFAGTTLFEIISGSK